MTDLKLAQRFALVALNAQDSRYGTMAKRIALRCVAAAVVLEVYLEGDFTLPEQRAALQERVSGAACPNLYQEVVFKPLSHRPKAASANLRWWLRKASGLTLWRLRRLEHTMADFLKGMDALEEIPNLIGCDMMYTTAGNTLREYRSNVALYTSITEEMRAELLEPGAVTEESICLLWLLKESGCIHDIFSRNELETVTGRMGELYHSNPLAKTLFSIDIRRGLEFTVKNFMRFKKDLIKTPTGTGINFVFPVLERSQAIFIDTEAWFEKAPERLRDVRARLDSNGHSYTILHEGQVPIIKIDNIVYEAIPTATQGRVPIHGVRLRRYPI